MPRVVSAGRQADRDHNRDRPLVQHSEAGPVLRPASLIALAQSPHRLHGGSLPAHASRHAGGGEMRGVPRQHDGRRPRISRRPVRCGEPRYAYGRPFAVRAGVRRPERGVVRSVVRRSRW